MFRHAGEGLGTTKVAALAGATRFLAEDAGLFIFSEFPNFLTFFWGGRRAEANSRQATCNLAPIWHQNPALEWVIFLEWRGG